MVSASLLAASQFQGAALRIQSQKRVQVASGLPVVRCEAEGSSRRAILTGIGAGAAALAVSARPSQAAYGESAKIFGGLPSNATGFIPYEGDGYAMLVPSKWNPSAKREYPSTILRYEDNYYVKNSLSLIKKVSDKSRISDFGTPEKFLEDNGYLFGRQSFKGDSQEGGYNRGRVAQTNLLEVETSKDKQGREYYKFHAILRTADGTEGGSHQLITASVDDKRNLYILKVEIGDKRWYTGAKKYGEGIWNSFVVA